jgi:hypothetical protein
MNTFLEKYNLVNWLKGKVACYLILFKLCRELNSGDISLSNLMLLDITVIKPWQERYEKGKPIQSHLWE